jgi:hypothetical protein
MKILFCSVLVLVSSVPLSAQTTKPEEQKPEARESQRERALKRCKENRGINCDTAAGLREWLREETPLTDEQQQAAAGARRHREECAKNKKATNC